MSMYRGLCALFGGSGREVFPDLLARGVEMIRTGPTVPEIPDDQIRMILGEFVGLPIRLLYIVGGQGWWANRSRVITPAEIHAETERVLTIAEEVGLREFDLQCVNEPDVAGHSPAVYAPWVAAMHDAIRARGDRFGGRLLAGGCKRFDVESFEYLDHVIKTGLIPEDVIMDCHRYPVGMDPVNPHPGFTDREHEFTHFRALVAPRLLACTEVGYCTAPVGGGINLSEAEAAAALRWELDWLEAHGFYCACIYQLNDGYSKEPIDHYGLRHADTSWKIGTSGLFTRA